MSNEFYSLLVGNIKKIELHNSEKSLNKYRDKRIPAKQLRNWIKEIKHPFKKNTIHHSRNRKITVPIKYIERTITTID